MRDSKPDENSKEHALAILEGEIPPTNDVMAFIVKRAREAREAGNQLLGMEQDLEKRLGLIRKRIAGTQGALNQYQADVRFLLEEANPASPDEGAGAGADTED